MKIFFLILLSILAMPHHLIANEESGCDQIIEEVEITPTMSLTAYFQYLLDAGVISTKNLNAFKESLHKNRFINPIEHTITSQGPAVHPAANYAHYVQIQQYLDFQKSNPHFLDLDKLEQLTEELIQSKSLTMSSRSNTKIATNFPVFVEKILRKGLGDIESLFDLMAKSSPQTSTKFALQLLESEVPFYNQLGEQLLAKMYLNQNYDNLLFLMNVNTLKKGLYTYVRNESFYPFFADNGSEEYYQFVVMALSSNIPELYKEYILSQIKNPLRKETIEVIKNLTLAGRESSKVAQQAVRILYETQKVDDILPYFLEMASNDSKYNFWAANDAMKYLFDLKIRGYKFDLPPYEKFINEYGSLLYDLPALKEKSDPISLQLIKEAIHSLDKKGKTYAINLLKGRKDEKSLTFIRNLFPIFPNKEQLQLKLEILTGRDSPWVLSLIQKNLNNSEFYIKVAAYKALRNMSSIDSRNIIENLYLSKKKNFENRWGTVLKKDWPTEAKVIDQEISFLLEAVENRPENDVVYFVDRYLNSKNEEIVEHALKGLYGKSNQKIKQICEEKIINLQSSIAKVCFDYLKSLPIQENLPYWRNLAKAPFSEKDSLNALEKLLALNDSSTKLLLQNFMTEVLSKDIDQNISHLLPKFFNQYDQKMITLCFETLKTHIKTEGYDVSKMPHNISACLNYLSLFPTQQFIVQWRQLATPPFETQIKELALKKLIEANDQDSKNLLTHFLEKSPEGRKSILFQLTNWASNPKILQECSAQKGPQITWECLDYLLHQPIQDHLQWWKEAAQKPYSNLIRITAIKKLAEHFDREIGQILKKAISEKTFDVSAQANTVFFYHYLLFIEKIENNISVTDEEAAFFE